MLSSDLGLRHNTLETHSYPHRGLGEAILVARMCWLSETISVIVCRYHSHLCMGTMTGM